MVAAACLFTSAKIAEYPKGLQNVLKGVWQCKFQGNERRLLEMAAKVPPPPFPGLAIQHDEEINDSAHSQRALVHRKELRGSSGAGGATLTRELNTQFPTALANMCEWFGWRRAGAVGCVQGGGAPGGAGAPVRDRF